MFKDAFVKLNAAEAQDILDKINPKLQGSAFTPESATVMAHDLPFYPGYRFFFIADHSSVPEIKKFAVCKDDDVTILNWTNEPIYQLNKAAPISLNEDNISQYVQFFFTYIRGRHGRFQIVENVDDIDWKEEPPPAARKAIGKMLEPVSLKNIGEDGTYNLIAQMIFKDSLFQSAVHVTPDGFVSLSDEELLVEDMPVSDDTLGQ